MYVSNIIDKAKKLVFIDIPKDSDKDLIGSAIEDAVNIADEEFLIAQAKYFNERLKDARYDNTRERVIEALTDGICIHCGSTRYDICQCTNDE